MQRGRSFRRDLDVVQPRAVPNDDLEHGIDLVVRLIGPFECLDQGDIRAVAELQARPDEHRGRCAGRGDMSQMDRPLQHDIGLDRNHDTVGRERAVQCRNGIGPGASSERQNRLVRCQRLGRRADADAGFEVREIGQFGNKCAVDDQEPPEAETCAQRTRLARGRVGGGIRPRRKRLGIAHQAPEVGVLPCLDTRMRQALRDEAIKRIAPQRAGLTAARQTGPGRSEQVGQADFGSGLHGSDLGIHGNQAASF